jgi:hypothetical protein
MDVEGALLPRLALHPAGIAAYADARHRSSESSHGKTSLPDGEGF